MTYFVGIDPTAAEIALTYSVLDDECNLLDLKDGNLDEIIQFISKQETAMVAINGPSKPNLGVVLKEMHQQNLQPGQLRGTDLRKAEQILRNIGILVTPTPSKFDLCPEWMQLSFQIHKMLGDMGFKYFPDESGARKMLETQPHAAFCVLVEGQLLPKPTLEGRLQRQMALRAAHLNIKDPLEFFEEITSHRLIKGILPMDKVYSANQLDALMAAYVAFLAGNEPDRISFVGNVDEGRIALPGSKLKEKY